MNSGFIKPQILLAGALLSCGIGAKIGVAQVVPTTGAMPMLAPRGVYPRVEASFELPRVTADQFDFTKNDVQVAVVKPDGSTVKIPAFYDGGTLWRARYTPNSAGAYKISAVTLNGQPAGQTRLEPQQWVVAGTPTRGFVRIDPKNARRFAFDNGQRYYPIGHNVAWGDVPVIFPKMGAAGESWSRIWMTHFTGNNLDWVSNQKMALGQLDLGVARKWDIILDNAEQQGIYFQMTLQHHGQYSTSTNPNWQDNPWNTANGGFLANPELFFTDARARDLTKQKYRYIVARFGYSPSIMAWELFNEVQWTDSINNKHEDTVAAWHREMAAFLRAQDPFHHLITTSDSRVPSIFATMDYNQHHDYPNDLIGSAATGGSALPPEAKPDFGGEVDTNGAQPFALRGVLYAGLMAGESGAAQPWFWDVYERDNLYSTFASATRFVKASGIGERNHLKRIEPTIVMPQRIDLVAKPGGDWVDAKSSTFIIDGSNPPAGISQFPAYFFGENSRAKNPNPTIFKVNYPKPAQMTIHANKVSKGGAHLKISLDGKLITERDFPVTPADSTIKAEIPLAIPAGKHDIQIVNTGADWLLINDFTFSDAATPLGSYGVTDGQWMALWIYHRNQVISAQAPQTVSGKVAVSGLKPGQYRAIWWDTAAGKPIKVVPLKIVGSAPVMLDTPPVTRDIALYVRQ